MNIRVTNPGASTPVEVLHHRNMIGSALLLRRLRRLHYDHSPDSYKSRYLPVPMVGNVLVLEVLKRMESSAMKKPPVENDSPTPSKSIRFIQNTVCEHYDVEYMDIISSRRSAAVVVPRQVAMYLCRKFTTRSMPEIGRMFGGKDHTTVLHSIRKIESVLVTDERMATNVAALQDKIRKAPDANERA